MNIKGIWETREVLINDIPLPPAHSQRVFNHSPDGFSWGYSGSGPAQLALAILLLATSETNAVRLHQVFKREVIAPLPQLDDFEIEIDIAQWIQNQKVGI